MWKSTTNCYHVQEKFILSGVIFPQPLGSSLLVKQSLSCLYTGRSLKEPRSSLYSFTFLAGGIHCNIEPLFFIPLMLTIP